MDLLLDITEHKMGIQNITKIEKLQSQLVLFISHFFWAPVSSMTSTVAAFLVFVGSGVALA